MTSATGDPAPLPEGAASMTSPARSSPFALPLPRGLAFAGAVLSGLLYWLAFPGKESPAWLGLFSFVAFTPLWIALQKQAPGRALLLGAVTGATMNLCGFYWLLDMLQTFSGFPTPLCMVFVVIVCAYQGGRIGFLGWLYARAAQRGWPRPLVFLSAFAASELLYWLLFPWYFAATLHKPPS
jgi:apolipoprotein N-acyltransferase